MSKKIAVIGSNSFSGSHFVNHTLSEDCNVAGISRSPELNNVFLPYKTNKYNSNFQFFQLDINHDLNKIITVLKTFQPDYIVNFASQGMVGESWLYPEHWFQTNVVANIKLHDKLRKFDFLKKYIHVSTPEVYGSCEGTVQESRYYNPSTPYAVSKAAADMSLFSFFNAYNFPVVFTRAANVYGPGQQLYRIIPRTILFFLIGKKLQLHGGGKSIRSFIHIRDIAEGTLRAALDARPGEIYHLSTNENISIYSLVKMVSNQLNVPFEENVEIVGDRLGKDDAYLLDSTKAKKELAWESTITVEQGIDETIGWIKNNLEILKKLPLDYIHKP